MMLYNVYTQAHSDTPFIVATGYVCSSADGKVPERNLVEVVV